MSTSYKVQKQAKLICHVRSQSSSILGRGSSTWKGAEWELLGYCNILINDLSSDYPCVQSVKIHRTVHL